MLLERLEEIRAELGQFGDSFSQYSFLIELSALNNCAKADLMTEQNLFRGCQSQVWLRMHITDGAFFLEATSDTALLRGLLYVMMQLFNGCPAQEIALAEFDFLRCCGIDGHFTSQRTSGVNGILQNIRSYCTTAQKQTPQGTGC